MVDETIRDSQTQDVKKRTRKDIPLADAVQATLSEGSERVSLIICVSCIAFVGQPALGNKLLRIREVILPVASGVMRNTTSGLRLCVRELDTL